MKEGGRRSWSLLLLWLGGEAGRQGEGDPTSHEERCISVAFGVQIKSGKRDRRQDTKGKMRK